MSEEKLYIDDGELVYYINENEFIACDEIPMPMLEGIKHLQQKVEQLEKELQTTANNCKQLENIRKEVIEYLTSYESISTIQGLNDIEKNKILDEKTMNEMVNRYLKVHDNLLNILNKGDNNGK